MPEKDGAGRHSRVQHRGRIALWQHPLTLWLSVIFGRLWGTHKNPKISPSLFKCAGGEHFFRRLAHSIPLGKNLPPTPTQLIIATRILRQSLEPSATSSHPRDRTA
jgi:hypothetical protein